VATGSIVGEELQMFWKSCEVLRIGGFMPFLVSCALLLQATFPTFRNYTLLPSPLSKCLDCSLYLTEYSNLFN
jgi:hypothetical protein